MKCSVPWQSTVALQHPENLSFCNNLLCWSPWISSSELVGFLQFLRRPRFCFLFTHQWNCPIYCFSGHSKIVLSTNRQVASGCHNLLVVIYLFIYLFIFSTKVGHHFQSSSDDEDDFKPISFLHTESSLQQVEIFSLKCGVIYSSLLIFRHPSGFELLSL